MGDNIRENNIKIDYTGWFGWYIRWYNGGVWYEYLQFRLYRFYCYYDVGIWYDVGLIYI